jgi:hypothetical protein
VPSHAQIAPQPQLSFWDRIMSIFGAGPSSAPPRPQGPAPQPAPQGQPELTPSPESVAPMMGHWAEEEEPELAPARQTPPKSDKESVVYLGINDASREAEKKAFSGMKDATVLTGAGTDKEMQGKTLAADGETVLDLSKEEDVQQFLKEAGVGKIRTDEEGAPIESAAEAKKRMGSLEDIFLGARGEDGERKGGLDVGVRDEMAQFVQTLQKVEQGEMSMDRVVMSGHSSGNWVYSEAEGSPGVTFDHMGQIMNQFPQAQAGVEDFMLSACHTLEKQDHMDNRDGAQYQDIFPNLTNVWGYNGYSPNYKQGSVQHIRNWLKASEGDDTKRIQDMAKRTKQNAAVKVY